MITSLSIIIFSLVALTVAIHVCKGYKRGLTASLRSLCLILISAIFGALLAMLIAYLTAPLLMSMLSDMDFYEEITESAEGLENAILIVVRMLLTLVIYLPCFFLLRLIIFIPTKIITACLCAKSDGNVDFNGENEELYVRKHKAIAALVGALSGFIISVICQAPLAGAAMTVTRSVAFIENAAGEDLVDGELEKAFDYFGSDFSVSFIYACGGKTVFDFATSTFSEGEMVCLGDELDVICSLDVNELTELLEFNASADENAARVKALVDKVGQSKILSVAFVDTVKGLSTAWLKNEAYMDISRPSVGSESAINDVIDQLLIVCQTTDSAHIGADVTTLVNISSIIADHKEIFNSGSYEDVVNTLAEQEIVEEVKAELEKNPRMANVSAVLDDVVMQIIADEILDVKYSEEQRDVFYDQLAEILASTGHLNGTTRVTKVTEQIEIAFADYGVHIPEQLNEQIASKLIEDIDSVGGEVTYDDIYDYFENLINGKEDNIPPVAIE
ncbi:MAG: hypothetical protein IKV16_05410 [Clostridia bacterium]|nr:hypothetical protein [Clostridia bacterium]